MNKTPRILESFVTKGGDPNKPKTISVTGAQRDNQEGKYRFDLIGLHMLKRLARLLERGARKYAERNWEKGQETSRTLASLWRHVVAYQEGDREEDHLAAIVFNAMSIMHVEGEVLAGRLPAALLDLPFYAHLEDFAAKANEPTWHEQIVLDELPLFTAQVDDVYVTFNELKEATFPSVSEHEFAQVLASLTRKGLICPFVIMDKVHPNYALKSEVDKLAAWEEDDQYDYDDDERDSEWDDFDGDEAESDGGWGDFQTDGDY